MKSPFTRILKLPTLILGLLPALPAPAARAEAPSAQAITAFTNYTNGVEGRLARQHRSGGTFLAECTLAPPQTARLRAGELMIERLTPETRGDLPGAMLHHWRGTAFVPGATTVGFERLMRATDAYPTHFAPQVLQAKTLSSTANSLQLWMRVRQTHVLTVVLDATYDVRFGRLDAEHGYSTSRSVHIAEIDAPGTARERILTVSEEHGFLWRLNTYWSYEEKDGGLYMQIDCVSLTRSVPRGLGWVIGPFVESVPRESLEFTLRSTRDALRR